MGAFDQDVREILIKKIKDLQEKIENNEPFPEGDQDLNSLSEMTDKIDECLNAWYY